MEISFGGGATSAILDLRNGTVEIYNGGEEFHARLGGRQYYRSRSGHSGAGWLPDAPYLVKLGTIRRDAQDWYDPILPRQDQDEPAYRRRPSPLLGWLIWAPYHYGRGCSTLAEHHPIVMIAEHDHDMIVVVADEYELMRLLRGEIDLADQTTQMGGQYFLQPGAATPCSHGVIVVGRVRPSRALYALEEIQGWLFQRPKAPQPWEAGYAPIHDEAFWSRLGLVDGQDGYRYRLRRGRCTARVLESDCAEPAALQSVAPQSVWVPDGTSWLYVQRVEDGVADAVGRYEVAGVWVDYEIRLEGRRLIEILSGTQRYLRQLADELAAGAARKAASTQETEVTSELEAFLAQNADLDVTIEDGVMAGNCEPGVRRFAERSFPGRQSVRLADLLPFRGDKDVVRVLWHLKNRTAQTATA